MKTKFTKLHLLLLILWCSTSGYAQLNYQPGGFISNLTTYTDISALGTVISMPNNDDAFSSSQPIGFTFNFNGSSYNSFVLSTNGFIKLGGDSASRHYLFTAHAQPPPNGPFTLATSPTPLAGDSSMLFAFGQDLIADPSASPYTVYTDGATGSRVCTIQWKDVQDKIQGTPAIAGLWDTINFQIKLYETTNVIEYVYGKWTSTSSIPEARFSAVGIVGSSVTVVNQNLHLVKGSTVVWSGTVANTGFYANNGVNYRTPTSTPAGPAPEVGRRFSFTPIVLNDASVRVVYSQGRIALPYYRPDSIRANVFNPGVNPLTGLTVTLNITGDHSYTATANIASLASGANTTVAFPPFLPTHNGSSLVTVSVPSDDNNANNAATYGLSVGDNRLTYTDTTQGVTSSTGNTSAYFAGARFFVNGTGIVTTVRSFLVANSEALGDTVCGLVMDSTGLILGKSPNYIVQASDLGSTLVFNISAPPVVSNKSIIAGIAGGNSVDGAIYFLATSQAETPIRTNSPFYNMTQEASGGGITNAKVGAIYRTPIVTTSRLMMECTITPVPQVDIGVNAVAPNQQIKMPAGMPTPMLAVVRNNGLQTRPAGLEVRYQVGSGSIVGPVTTTTAIAMGDTTSVVFSGANVLNFPSTGTYTVKVFTSLAGDSIITNDTFTVIYTVVPAQNIPYRIDNNILASWGVQNPDTALFKNKSVVQANGSINANVLWADNILLKTKEARIFSPLFDFTGLTNPTLNFNVAHGPNSVTGKDDTLQVLVSADGGYSFSALYTKSSQASSPELGTDTATSASYQPDYAGDWRYETVNLSAYAGQPSVLICFRNRALGGNGVYIGNIAVTNPVSISEQSVLASGAYTSSNATVTFSATGASTGKVAIVKQTGTPFTSASPVHATNTTAITNNGSIFTPSHVSQSEWFTVTYSGVGTANHPALAQYTFSVDLSSISGIGQSDSIYILRRANSNASWVAVNTSLSGNILSTGSLTGFSDFVLGSTLSANALPVGWLGINGRNINTTTNEISWRTASETNNQYFEVEYGFDGEYFVSAGKTETASGSSNTVKQYHFTHHTGNEINQPLYYRIKQVDMDGSFSYSNTIQISPPVMQNDKISIENPFVNAPVVLANISETSHLLIRISDISGHVIANTEYEVQKGNNQIRLKAFDELQQGLYFIQIKLDNNKWITKKVIKL